MKYLVFVVLHARIRAEMMKIMTGNNAVSLLRTMEQCTATTHIGLNCNAARLVKALSHRHDPKALSHRHDPVHVSRTLMGEGAMFLRNGVCGTLYQRPLESVASVPLPFMLTCALQSDDVIAISTQQAR